jgi:hypothetical protein
VGLFFNPSPRKDIPMDMFNNPHKREQMMTIDLFKERYGVHITKEMNGKMEGFMSLSSSPLLNPICQARRLCDGSICKHCFSIAMQKRYGGLSKVLEKNTEVLTTTEIPPSEFPLVNAHAFRLEAFGDVQNETQVKNYFNFCRRNPRTTFSVWTKNPEIYQRVLESGVKKPKNLIIILSSHLVNVQANADKWDFVDKVFTVYDKAYAEKNNIVINCGKRKCLSCMNCYDPRGEDIINELLK